MYFFCSFSTKELKSLHLEAICLTFIKLNHIHDILTQTNLKFFNPPPFFLTLAVFGLTYDLPKYSFKHIYKYSKINVQTENERI